MNESPHSYPEGSGFSDRILFFLTDALEGLVVRLTIQKLTGVTIPLHPVFCFRIVSLAPVFDLAITMAVSNFTILCHILKY